jgi:hypothetical protein
VGVFWGMVQVAWLKPELAATKGAQHDHVHDMYSVLIVFLMLGPVPAIQPARVADIASTLGRTSVSAVCALWKCVLTLGQGNLAVLSALYTAGTCVAVRECCV